MAITQDGPSKLVSIQYRQLLDEDPCVLAKIKEVNDISRNQPYNLLVSKAAILD